MKHILNSPVAKVIIGLLIGIGLLFLVSRLVNIVAGFNVVLRNLTTPRGVVLALLSGVVFLLAYSLRGLRWKLFLGSISTRNDQNVTSGSDDHSHSQKFATDSSDIRIKASTAIRIYLVGIFVNFLF